MKLSLTAVLLVTVACGPIAGPTPVAPAAPVVPDHGGLRAEIEVRRQTGGTIVANDPVKSGDRFEVYVTLDHPSYLYVGGIDARGEAYFEFPKGVDDSAQLPAGRQRIPRRPSAWFQADDAVGDEVLVVIASRRPIADVDATIAEAVGELPTPDRVVTPDPVVEPDPVVVSNPAPTVVPKAPRRSSTWKPERPKVAAIPPRGALRPKAFRTVDAAIVIDGEGGLIVHVMPYRHVAP